MWERFRDYLHLHRWFPTSEWATPGPELDTLEDVLDRLRPAVFVQQFKWLFDDWRPDVPGTTDDHDQSSQLIADARASAVARVLAESQVEGLLALARAVKYPGFVGSAFTTSGELTRFAGDLVECCLGSPEQSLRVLGISFLSELSRTRGVGSVWALADESRLASHHSAYADLLLALPAGPETWDSVDVAHVDAQRLYWNQVSAFSVDVEDTQQAHRGIERLLDVDRAFDVLQVVSHSADNLETPLLVRVLDHVGKLINSGLADQSYSHLDYDVDRILSRLRKRPDVARANLLRLEWFYLPILKRAGRANVPTLKAALADEPALFAELIRWQFRSENDSGLDVTYTPDDKHRAGIARDLLASLTEVPGCNPDGTLDIEHLRSWITEVRAQCEKSGHRVIGDQQIGNILAWAPADADGRWPHRDLRDLFKQLENPEIERGVVIGALNRRGVTTRAWNSGGKQEHELADQYRLWSEATALHWPRTSALLAWLSRDYKLQAVRHDEDAERVDLSW